MTIQNMPTGNIRQMEFVNFWRPAGSNTVVFMEDMKTGLGLSMLRWGNEIYLPVEEGLNFGIGIHNGHSNFTAYPIFIEAKNLWDGGQNEPEACDTDHMWEFRAGQTQIVDKLMDPHSPTGRPLQIVPKGQGYGVGESTFGTTAFDGQIRVYERLALFGGGYQAPRHTNEGYSSPTLESFGGQVKGLGGTRGASSTRSAGATRGAAIGAGAEVRQDHHDTGVRYQVQSEPVIFLRMEYRDALHPFLQSVMGPWQWTFRIPSNSYWWNEMVSTPVSPQVPLAPGPHLPRR